LTTFETKTCEGGLTFSRETCAIKYVPFQRGFVSRLMSC